MNQLARRPAIVTLDWMAQRHDDRCAAIDEAAFPLDPWTAEMVRKQRIAKNHCAAIGRVNGDVAGYMIYELYKTRLQLLRLAVHPARQRRGVGSALVAKLCGKLHPEKRQCVGAEVREDNLEAQLFFRAMGFKAVSVLKSYYDDGADAYVFRMDCQQLAMAE